MDDNYRGPISGGHAQIGSYNAPATTGYAQTAPAPSETASRIRDGVTFAEQVLSEIHDAISFLEKRLDTVLSPAPPSNVEQSNNKLGPVASHLAGRVEILNGGFQAAVRRLRDLTQRVEV